MRTSTAVAGPMVVAESSTAVRGRPFVVLPLRLVGFGAVQGLIALAYLAVGTSAPWAASVPWWPVVATVVNVVTAGVVATPLHQEGRGIATCSV